MLYAVIVASVLIANDLHDSAAPRLQQADDDAA